MPITLVTGPANAGKIRVLMEALRAHAARGEEPLLVVPTRADAERYTRELAGESVALGVRVERFGGLIETIVRRAGLTVPVVGELARERMLGAIVERSRPQAGVGMVRALGEAIAELQAHEIAPARLRGALAHRSPGEDAASAGDALGAMYEEYVGMLAGLGRVDGEQRALRALAALRGAPALWGSTPTLFYGFDDLTRLQLAAVETLGRTVGAPVTVSLVHEPGRAAFVGRTDTMAALAALAEEYLQLGPRGDYYAPRARAALSHLERSLFEPAARRRKSQGAVRLVRGASERCELERVAEQIAALLDAGMAAREIAVVARAEGTSSELLAEVFSAAGVPCALSHRRRLADTAVGRALAGALRCAVVADAQDGRACSRGSAGNGADVAMLGDLLAWLRAPGLLERPELADRLERDARRAGVTDAARARRLWEGEHWRLDAIDRLGEAQRRGRVALIERAERELQWLFDAPRRRSASVLAAHELDDARALSAGRRALDELRELARIAPDLVPADAAWLAGWLERVEFVSGHAPGSVGAQMDGGTSESGAVAVLDPLRLLDAGGGRRVRALFVCGLQEGVFPARPRPQPFLAEEERRALERIAGLRLDDRGQTLAAERHLLYAIASRPEELLVLSWHTADDDGEPTARSLFVDDVCDLFEEDLLAASQRTGGASRREPTPANGETRAIAGAGSAEQPGDLVAQPGGLTDERLLEELGAHVWSASSLEVWISCPVRWFVERLLRPQPIDADPEPFARGGLAHAALKDTLEGLARERGSARLTPASLGRARELLDVALRDNEPLYPLSVVPERVPGTRRRLRADLRRYLEHAAAANSPLEPTALELGFGFAADDRGSALAGERGEGSDLPAFELGAGVRMRGRIDRVDTDAAGRAVVYDYKGRSAPAAAKWIADGSLQVALYMRAVEALLGVRAVGGFYQPLAGGDLRARGLLDVDCELELQCVRGDAREHDEVRELLDEALALALAAAGQAAAGELTPRPRTCSYNGGCMYPTICRCEG